MKIKFNLSHDQINRIILISTVSMLGILLIVFVIILQNSNFKEENLNKNKIPNNSVSVSYPNVDDSSDNDNIALSYPYNASQYTYSIVKDLNETQYLSISDNLLDNESVKLNTHTDDPKAKQIYDYYAALNLNRYKDAAQISTRYTEKELENIYKNTTVAVVAPVVKVNEYTYESYVSIVENKKLYVYKIIATFDSNYQASLSKIDSKLYSDKYYLVCNKKDSENTLQSSWCIVKTSDNFVIKPFFMPYTDGPLLFVTKLNNEYLYLSSGFGDAGYAYSIFLNFNTKTGELVYLDELQFFGTTLWNYPPDTFPSNCTDQKLVEISEYLTDSGCFYKYQNTDWYKNNLYYLQNRDKYFDI